MKSIRYLVGMAMMACLGEPASAQSQPMHQVSVDIPAQPVGKALNAFAQQTGMRLLFRAGAVKEGAMAPRLLGSFTAGEALEKLLEATELEYKFLDDRTVAIRVARPVASAEGAETTWAHADQWEVGSHRLMLARADAAETSEPISSTAQSDSAAGESLAEVLVSAKAFTDANVDIVRTRDDAQPYYILSGEVIEQSGASNVEDYLKQRLTMNAMPLASNQYSTYARGNTSSINLRGIGNSQTLILINGRRTSVGNYVGQATEQPDVNAIPLAAIDRVEVLPSSSAAIYGGAAVGGVVNIVLKKDYVGTSLKAKYESTFEGGAEVRSINLAHGFALEERRTHGLIAAYYSDSTALLREDRPQIVRGGIERVLERSPQLLYSGSLPFNAGATTNIASNDGSPLTLRDGTPLGSSFTHVPATISPSTPDALLNAGLLANAGTYDFSAPDTANYLTGSRFYLGSAPSVQSILASVRRQMTDSIEAFIDLSFSKNEAQSPFNALSGRLLVPASSPANPFQQAVQIAIPDPSWDYYQASLENRRATIGGTMDLPYEWRAQTDYTWNYTELRYGSSFANTPRLNTALADGSLDPFVNTVLSPLNLSPYLLTLRGYAPAELGDLGLRAAGPIWALPGGAPMLAIGLEMRREKFLQGSIRTVNNAYSEDDAYQRLLNQEQRTLSAYTELKIPIFSKLNSLPGVRELDLQLAARSEKYSMITRPASTYVYGTAANLASNVPLVRTDIDYSSTNPTFALRYKPIDSLMLRASYGTAFLPPSYSQLSAPIEDPASTITVVDPRRGNALTQIHPIRGGNPDIEPQGSKNWNVGLVFEPAAVSGLRASLEWFRLEQDNVIVTPTVQQMVDLESQFPGRIARAAPAPGETVGAITEVNATLINANKGETAGLDATLEYRLRTPAFGTFSFFAMGTRVTEYRIQNTIAAPLEDIVNELGRGGPVKLRVNGGVTWDRNFWSASWLMRYFGSYKQYDVGTNAYVIAQGSEHVPSQQYHDVMASYRFGKLAASGNSGSSLMDGVEIQLGVKNVFNKAPPFDAYYGVQSIYYSPLGDPRLRSYWMSVSKSF